VFGSVGELFTEADFAEMRARTVLSQVSNSSISGLVCSPEW
jgi:hypothetical protein